jgi:hypothetical protein
MNHFYAVAFAQARAGVLAARDNIQIKLNGHTLAGQLKVADQISNRLAIWELERLTVQLNMHDGTVTF